MDLVEPHLQNLLTIFYGQRDKFVKVLDLLNASIQNKTPENIISEYYDCL
jgi:hypothetical protein